MRRVLAFVFLCWLARPLGALSYVQASGGLVPPTWENGRTELELADVNRDGYPDIVSIGDHGSPWINSDQHGVMVWFGSAQGQWSSHCEGSFGYGGIACGDLNNDGLLDVAYGMHHNYSSTDFGDQLIEAALGDGTGRNWVPWDDGLATAGETWGMFCTDLADVDLDGDLDLVANSFGAGAGIHVYLNNLDGTWTHSFGFLGGNSDEDVVFGDVDGNGIPDFAASHQYGTVYLGDGRGGFTVVDGNLPGSAYSRVGVALGDVDGDGADELSFCRSGGVAVWKYLGGTTWTNLSGSLPQTGSYTCSQLCDMDGDGFVDVVAYGGGLCRVWTGDGGGTWTLAASFSTPTPSFASAFRTGVDCDHNGLPDIALVAEEGQWPSERNRMRFYKEASVPSGFSIALREPGPSRVLVGGSVRRITWCASVPDGGPGTVDLFLSVEGPQGPWLTLATGIPNGGSFQWTVPAGITSPRCWLRAVLHAGGRDVETVSASPFAIVPSPMPVLRTWVQGGSLLLSWCPVPGTAWYHLYRDLTAHFQPDTSSYSNRVAVLPASQTWYSSSWGVGDPEVSAFYRVLAVASSGQEVARSWAAGELDYPLSPSPVR